MTQRECLELGLKYLGVVPKNAPQAVDYLLQFGDILVEKNKVMNLTAITEPIEIVTRHFLDCAALAPKIFDTAQILDIGTGAGFPGMPLSMLTNASFVLLDSLKKRIDFLQEVVTILGLENVLPLHERAEAYAASHREDFDIVTSRAVADLRLLAEMAMPCLRIGGVFYAMKAERCEDEVENAKNAISLLGGEPPKIEYYDIPFTDITRSVVCIRKIGETPQIYPRRFSKMQRMPL